MSAAFKHDCRTELRDADLKATPARLGILEALEHSETPLDVTGLIRYLKIHRVKANRATVFRIVNALSRKGLTTPIQFNEGKFRYEHSAKADHHHFICEKCSQVTDITGCNVDALEENLEKKKGFQIKHHSLEFFGLCKNCRK